MSNTNANFEMTGILLGQEVRKRKTPQEKIDIIQQTMEPGMNVSHGHCCKARCVDKLSSHFTSDAPHEHI
ncbi:hypothetical protein DMR84_28760 [Klebsiella variicola]|nr:hypothetical protein DMR84_28760 [Klebsiella variicola]